MSEDIKQRSLDELREKANDIRKLLDGYSYDDGMNVLSTAITILAGGFATQRGPWEARELIDHVHQHLDMCMDHMEREFDRRYNPNAKD